MPEDTPEEQDPRGLREAVERANREAAEAKAALADMQRISAFRDAGLDPQKPLHAAIINGYGGEPGEIGAFVAGLNLNQDTPPPPPIPQDEQDALNRVAGIGSGDGGLPPDARAEGDARLRALVQQGIEKGWTNQKFGDEMSAEMERQGRPVAHLQIQG